MVLVDLSLALADFPTCLEVGWVYQQSFTVSCLWVELKWGARYLMGGNLRVVLDKFSTTA